MRTRESVYTPDYQPSKLPTEKQCVEFNRRADDWLASRGVVSRTFREAIIQDAESALQRRGTR